MLVYKRADVFEVVESTTDWILAHGVSCQGVMGAGVAKDVKMRYPHAFSMYLDCISQVDSQGYHDVQRYKMLMGSVKFAKVDKKKRGYVANCFTQEQYGRDKSVVYLSYDALYHSLREVARFSLYEKHLNIYMPLIGCGYANGSERIVRAVFAEVFEGEYPDARCQVCVQ